MEQQQKKKSFGFEKEKPHQCNSKMYSTFSTQLIKKNPNKKFIRPHSAYGNNY